MSSSPAITGGVAASSYPASALIPFTQTFVLSDTITTPIALVGQVLDTGATNFVGYDSGSAVYIVSSGADDAMQTTLADGMTYYVSEGAAPGGYLLTSGGAEASQTSSAAMETGMSRSSGTTRAQETGASESGGGESAMTGGMGSGSAAASTSAPGVAGKVEVGGWIAGVLGLLAVFGL